MFANINSEYPIGLLKSTGKKSFEALGRAVNKSSKTISRSLSESEENLLILGRIAKNIFQNKKELILAIDDSTVKKIYSRFMQGTGRFYDLKIGREVMGFKIQCSSLTDGKYLVPVCFSYLFSSQIPNLMAPSKSELFKNMVLSAQDQFPDKKIITVADGLFSTKEILQWCINANVPAEMRMHSNRKVMFEGKISKLTDIKKLQPTGRHITRTLKIEWHGMSLFISGHKRRDKHGNETIVYLVSTFKAKPAKHAATYKKRWGIEKMFRTTKQYLGLADCYSLSLRVQANHISSVFLTYALAQVAQKLYRFENPETAIRWLKAQDSNEIKNWISRLGQIFGDKK